MAATGSLNASDMVLFAEVVDAGTITACSQHVGLERSTVSRRMTSLEERLGVPLLNRSGRNLALTAAGQRYYEYCRRVIEAAEAADAEARGYYIEPHGALNIHAAMSEVEAFLSNLIDDFTGQNRNVDVLLSLYEDNLMTADAVGGLGICLGHAYDSTMKSERLTFVAESIWASPVYLSKHSAILSPDDISDHVCLSHGVDEEIRWRLTNGNEQRSVHLTPRYRVQSLLSVRQAALADLGLGILPDYLCHSFERRGELVRVLPQWQPPGKTLMAVYPNDRFLPRNAKAFLQYLKSEMQSSSLQALLGQQEVVTSPDE